MGIYIPDMEMPKTCADCDFVEPIGLMCTRIHKFLDREDYRHERHKDCPLKVDSCEGCKHLTDSDRFWICPKCKRQYEDKYEMEIRSNKEVNTNE